METKKEVTEKILARLKKIMSLKEGAEKIGSLAEAEAAMLAAQRLMVEYNLTLADIPLDDNTIRGAEIIEEKIGYFDKRTGGDWRMQLMQSICNGNFCDLIYWSKSKHMAIIGTKENVEVVTFLYYSLSERLFLIAKEEEKKERIYNDKRYIENISKDAYYRRFLRGAAVGVGIKLRREMKELEMENAKVTGLILFNDKALQTYMSKNHSTAKARTTNHVVDSIFIKGFETGKNINLQKTLK